MRAKTLPKTAGVVFALTRPGWTYCALLERGRSPDRCALVMVVLLLFVYPNTHICLAFYPTRLEREKEKAEAFCLICLLGLRVLRRRF